MYLFSPTLESEDYTENVFILAILPNLLRDMKKFQNKIWRKIFSKMKTPVLDFHKIESLISSIVA